MVNKTQIHIAGIVYITVFLGIMLNNCVFRWEGYNEHKTSGKKYFELCKYYH